jgi:hypothetical protein
VLSIIVDLSDRAFRLRGGQRHRAVYRFYNGGDHFGRGWDNFEPDQQPAKEKGQKTLLKSRVTAGHGNPKFYGIAIAFI